MSLPAQKFRTNRRPIQPGSSLEIAHGSASATHSQQPSSRTVGSSETPFSASSLANSVELEQDDLLRSFDDLDAAGARKSPQRQRRASEERDGILLGEDSRKELESANNAHRQGPSTLTSRIDRFDPMHVNLPPRPSEISPDYAPPLLSPRRLSQVFSSHGPGPQPQVSDAGRDIIFHPSFDPQSSEQGAEVARPASTRHSSGGQSTVSGLETSSRHGLAQSMLFNTLASTTKLAAKWKHVLEPSAIAPSDMQNHPHQHVHGHQTLFSSGIAQAIDITHSSPFASAQQIAGSYVPPGGAPGFDPSFLIAPIHVGQSDDFSGTRLLGRRDGTVSVLLHKDADKVRKHVPPRQRLSNTWTLIFSLDQHGASLSTLYRLVEHHAVTHAASGNVLIVRDTMGNVFGAYMNEAIAKREGTYYGNGESFMFKLLSGHSDARTFNWTGKNQYFALCEAGFISFGGGAGSYGLLLNSTFSRNSSATCPTFDNEILCASESLLTDKARSFDCLGLEVWGT